MNRKLPNSQINKSMRNHKLINYQIQISEKLLNSTIHKSRRKPINLSIQSQLKMEIHEILKSANPLQSSSNYKVIKLFNIYACQYINMKQIEFPS